MDYPLYAMASLKKEEEALHAALSTGEHSKTDHNDLNVDNEPDQDDSKSVITQQDSGDIE